jgi:hypothetical protein
MSELRSLLKAEFGVKYFDATDAWDRATTNPALTAALDAELPRIRYKSGEINVRAIRYALRRMSWIRKRHNGRFDYWQFKVEHEP